jgi:hypothetical protein
MPELRVSPFSIVSQIKGNLQDRYHSGFPILKELLQNADDAHSRKFWLDGRSGWPNAGNPLLRGPGLLIANDGEFRPQDERGITFIGESAKATDAAAIGKFGLGQKAVFHLCDAFVVYAPRSNDPFNTVINPFLGVDVENNITHYWDQLSDGDLEVLRQSVPTDFRERGLILWAPFRRAGLQPAPGASFSTNRPTLPQTMRELARSDELRSTLTALRHLESVELREDGQVRCLVVVEDGSNRLLGPDKCSKGWRRFSGSITSKPSGEISNFVGREAIVPDVRLEYLRDTPHWPKIISIFNRQPEREKGEPHGAATIIRLRGAEESQIDRSWAVFLPTDENAEIVTSREQGKFGRIKILLHGYFFLDSGRRRIDGIEEPASNESPVDAIGLRRAWNSELRDKVVLPLVPGVLHDMLNAKMASSAELAEIVTAIAKDIWFVKNRRGVCGTHSLVRVLESSDSVVWRLVPPSTKLRPIPASVLDYPERLADLFPEIDSWAKSHDITLCIDDGAFLVREPIRWKSEELASLFLQLSPQAFQSGASSTMLVDFLAGIQRDDSNIQALGSHLASKLRIAITGSVRLATQEQLSAILTYVPDNLLFRLPKSVENRRLIGALAAAPTDILPVRDVWVADRHPPRLVDTDLRSLLGAIERLVDEENDEAATAALALLLHAKSNLQELSQQPGFASIKVLRAQDVRAGHRVSVSLQTLLKKVQEAQLFTSTPDALRLLPLTTAALPDVNPLIIGHVLSELLEGGVESSLSVLSGDKRSIFSVINKAYRFGREDARAKLLLQLRVHEDDDRMALRRLCTGTSDVGNTDKPLWILKGGPSGLERIVTKLLASMNELLIPTAIAENLTARMLVYLGIQEFDTQALEALLEKNPNALSEFEPSQSECEAFLISGLSDILLRCLPIYTRPDGSIGNAEGVYREADWAIPSALSEHVMIVKPFKNEKAQKRLKDLIAAWTPQAQIVTALSLSKPEEYHTEILDALAMLSDRREELPHDIQRALRESQWLLAADEPISPHDVLTLPADVEAAAKAVLFSNAGRALFLPVGDLPLEVKKHPAFGYLVTQVLPDQSSSFAALTMMIQDAGLIARVGPTQDYPSEDFGLLGKAGADLALPGWALLGTILTFFKAEPVRSSEIVAAFSEVPIDAAELAARHLDALAAWAERRGSEGEAARRAYRHGFNAVTDWPEPERRSSRCRTTSSMPPWR